MHYLFIFVCGFRAGHAGFYSNLGLIRAERLSWQVCPSQRWWLVGWGVLLRTEWSLCLHAPSLCI
jgi:hypothetical protein